MALTLCKLRRIVIHITQGNCHCCSSRESTHMSSHVLCLDDHKIFFFGFSVHVGKSCFNYSYNNGGGNNQVQTEIQCAAVSMGICKYWYTKKVKGPVRLPLSTKNEKEFEILKKNCIRGHLP